MGNKFKLELPYTVDPIARRQETLSSASGASLQSLVDVMTIPVLRPQVQHEGCKYLVDILNNRVTKYDIPHCLRNACAAYAFEGIVAHTFFNIIEECDRAIFFSEIRTFKEVNCNSITIPSLSATTLITWVSRQLNISRLQASLVLGDFMQIRPEWCLTRFPITNDCGFPQSQRESFSLPESLVTVDKMFNLTAKYPIRGIDGQTLQLACRYSAGDAHVTVYADQSMRFGAQALPAFLPARNLIEANPQARVYFFMCPDILWRYIALAREGKLAERAGVIVTGNFGAESELVAMNLSPLLFHPVVIVCQKKRPEYDHVEKFAARCLESGAAYVRIFSDPINA